MARPLTVSQSKVLKYIASFIAENSYPPTVREIADSLSLNPGSTQYHIIALQRKGFIAHQNGQSRTIRILKKGA